MISNVCRIEKGTSDLDAILKESQKVAEYNELSHKQSLQLRLICEEMDGMLPRIIDGFSGDFWIEYVDGLCKVNASVKLEEFTAEKKNALIGVSKSGKNASAMGIVGKIRSELESFFLDENTLQLCAMSAGPSRATMGYTDCMDYSYLWTLEQYKTAVKNESKTEAWDELEKSVIASVADDIIVGIKGKRADIVIIKRFA